MKNRIGGTAKRTEKPNCNIETPGRTAMHIADYLSPHYRELAYPKMLDACAGSGILGCSFLHFAFKGHCKMYDIHPKSKMVNEKNVLEIKETFDIIICNPPWPEKIAKEIFHHLYKLLNDGGVMFFLINNVFCYQGYERAKDLKFQKYYFLPRYAFQESGRPLLDCGVMVSHKGPVPEVAAELSPFIPFERVKK